jgi:hypothetical protein
MTDYESMSDFEINKAVAERLGYDEIMMGYNPDSICCRIIGVKDSYGERDYCNNPSDAWPIIVDNRITIDLESSPHCYGKMKNSEGKVKYFHPHTKALRAAMIVYLMMQENDND